jgi:hypothetical protein
MFAVSLPVVVKFSVFLPLFVTILFQLVSLKFTHFFSLTWSQSVSVFSVCCFVVSASACCFVASASAFF